jgi:glutathione synthase/RimK-type ligase-like ATP-grasp enzyme
MYVVIMIVIARFAAIAQEISSEFGLSLFGFDVIVPLKPNASPSPDTTMAFHESNIDENSRFVVIDVNFFPSYKEVKDFPSRLRSFLREKSGFPPFRETPPSSF